MEPPESMMLDEPGVAADVPPQVEDRALGEATTSPERSESVKATPLRAVEALGFTIRKLTVVMPPGMNLLEANDLVMLGGARMLTLAFEVLPAPPLVELTVTELFCMPDPVAVTFTEKVQLADAARVALERLTVEPAAVAVIVPPPQVPVSPLGVETTNPAGSESVNATPVRLVPEFGFMMVKLRLVLPPGAMVAAPKDFVILGGASTVMLAFEVLPVPPSLDVTVTELFFVPDVEPVTFTEKVQLAEAARVAPARLTVEPAAVAVIVPPPQVPVCPLGVETTNPAGRESVNATPVRLVPEFGFVTVKLRLVLPP
jgi:hypothetical protein